MSCSAGGAAGPTKLARMAKTERSTDIAKPPEAVFPYLFEEGKVPQWTTGLHKYERLDGGALGKGSKFRENLEVSGQKIDAVLELTAYDPPRGAETRTEIRGIDVISTYDLQPSGGGTRLTQTIEATGGGLKGRVLIPMIQPYLERKLDADLAALAALLG
jgi:carbon monoxide dehydrogenase subunit G